MTNFGSNRRALLESVIDNSLTRECFENIDRILR